MKQVLLRIPKGRFTVVVETVESLGFTFVASIAGEDATIDISVPNNKTALVIEVLKGIGVGQVFGTLRVAPVDIELSSVVIKGKQDAKLHRVKGKGISLDEMIANIGGMGQLTPSFCILCILASSLAAFGLIYDSVVIVIASMIIAPLLGPIAMSVIGSLMAGNAFRLKAPLAEVVGLSICVAVGMLVGVLQPLHGGLPDQVVSRTSPGLGDVAFAIGSGMAAGIFIIRGESTNLVGVAVAASLCPPATNIGVLLANGLVDLAFGSFMLLILNVISIYAACAIIFWISQSLVRGGTISSRQFKKISKRYYAQVAVMIGVLVLVILAILVVFA